VTRVVLDNLLAFLAAHSEMLLFRSPCSAGFTLDVV
jgi:hypothetical protein